MNGSESSTTSTDRLPVWAFVSAAWLGPAVLAAFQVYVEGRLGGSEPATWRALLWQGGDWLICAVLTPPVFWLAGRYPLTRVTLPRNLPLHMLGAILLCVVWAGAGIGLSEAMFGTTPYDGGALSWFFTTLPFGVAVYFALLGVAHAVTFFLEARERETQAARLSAQLAEARLGALRMQLRPHFLFNTLNAVNVIVRDRDPATASRVLEQLVEMLRRVMRSDRPQEVSLADELDFVRHYLAIEQVRFSDRLRPAFEAEPALEGAAVPEFILQPLVENAVRHGLAEHLGAVSLRISARREDDTLILSVSDDGPGLQATVESATGVGLANTRERLATLYGERATLELAAMPGGGARAIVRLPYRELESRRG